MWCGYQKLGNYFCLTVIVDSSLTLWFYIRNDVTLGLWMLSFGSLLTFCDSTYWCKVKNRGKVHPCTGTEALYRPYGPQGSRGIALLFHYHGTRRGWVVSVTPRPLFTPGKDPVPIVQEAGWAPRPVWTVAKNLAPSPHRDSIPGPSSP